MTGVAGSQKKREQTVESASWPLSHCEALKEYVSRGLSYADAAEAVNARFGTAYSRSAALGRVRRMRLAEPEPPKSPSLLGEAQLRRLRERVDRNVRLVDRKARSRSVDQLSVVLRDKLKSVPGITVTHVGLRDSVGGNKPIEFSLQGTDFKELERLTQRVMDAIRPIPGLVDLDSSQKPDKPTVSVVVRRDAASDLGLGVAPIAAALRTLVAGTTVGNWRAPDDQTYDVNVRLAPEVRNSPGRDSSA